VWTLAQDETGSFSYTGEAVIWNQKLEMIAKFDPSQVLNRELSDLRCNEHSDFTEN
jgi:hypothetical protein